MATCEIQWVEAPTWEPTPDTRDAVAVVQCLHDTGPSQGYHICSRHLARVQRMNNWRVTYAMEGAPDWAVREAKLFAHLSK